MSTACVPSGVAGELQSLVTKAAHSAARRYPPYVTAEDCEQEIWAWLFTGVDKLHRWHDEQAEIYRDMLTAAFGYAEREKAARSGYAPTDAATHAPLPASSPWRRRAIGNAHAQAITRDNEGTAS